VEDALHATWNLESMQVKINVVSNAKSEALPIQETSMGTRLSLTVLMTS